MKKIDRFIAHRIKDKCKENLYEKIFNKEIQQMVEQNIDKLAEMTCEDGRLEEIIDFEIEESIRLMILERSKNTKK